MVAPLQREETHRVVRKYKKFKDYFFRLNMVTEQLDKLHFGHERMQPLLDFMIGILGNGINFGGSSLDDSFQYDSEIVNYSNSQLKSHSIWMIVKTKIPQIQLSKIISDLGEFDTNDEPLKMYARRGQCFTTTKFVTVLSSDEVRVIPDIKIKKEPGCTDPDGEYTFTDGCGNISIELGKLVNEKLGLYLCTAYQIRLGGAKGTLVCKPSLG